MFGPSRQMMLASMLAASTIAIGCDFGPYETAQRTPAGKETRPRVHSMPRESKLRRRLRRKHELGMSGSF